jgi:soluble lytic murein transglycosylase-like protein
MQKGAVTPSQFQPAGWWHPTKLGLLLGMMCAPAWVGATIYQCTDEWGHSYRLRQLPSSNMVQFRCEASAAEPQAAPLTSELGLMAMPDPHVWREPIPRPRSIARIQAPRQIPADLEQLIRTVATEHNHDPALLRAVVEVESAFNPQARSHKGAMGLMQVMPDTGRRFGASRPEVDLLHPGTNLRTGARYLTWLKGQFAGRLDLVLAAYNAGEGAVIRHGVRIPPYPETQQYVHKVLARYRDNRFASAR